MSMNDQISAEKEREVEMEAKKAFLELLIKNEDLGGDAVGVARKVAAEGEDSLTPEQRFVFKRDVLRAFARPCEGCDCHIPWEDKYEAYHEWDGFCFDCYDGMTKDRDE
jgi:hypothetical protein